MKTKIWKPQLLPNDKSGEIINWEERIKNPSEWLVSYKYDGNRVEIIDGVAYSREMKIIKSIHVQYMAQRMWEKYDHQTVIEAEFNSTEMNWAELAHFFKSEDVTSEATVKKYTNLYNRTNGVGDKWKFPGRSVKWLTTWHESLKFYIFDEALVSVLGDTRTKEERYNSLVETNTLKRFTDDAVIIGQVAFTTIKQIYGAYDQVVKAGGEGLVIMRKKSLYKTGRITLNSNQGYKIKDSNVEFEGVIIGIEEGTVARDGAEKSVNAFGRSKTSQLKEDRIPSGMCKGFKVKMDDGKELTVSLNKFTNKDKIDLLYGPSDWIGQRITFTGMNPVKPGGMPRHAHYSKED